MESTAETTTQDVDSDDEMHDIAFAQRGGCCQWNIPIFSSCCFNGRGPSSIFKWERISNSISPEKEEGEERGGWWVIRACMKLREWSEIVAGPRWKTFIRRFNNKNNYNCSRGGCCGGGLRRNNGKLFQYDPLSYALNFDDGQGQNGHVDFSSRYAAIPVSAKTSTALVFT